MTCAVEWRSTARPSGDSAGTGTVWTGAGLDAVADTGSPRIAAAGLAALLPDVSHASAMPRPLRPHIAAGRARLACAAALIVAIGACSTAVSGTGRRASPRPTARPSADPSTSPHPTRSTATAAQGEFSFAFAGDVHFAERTADLLAHPA